MLVLAVVLNPRSKKAAQRGEQKPRAGASDDGSGDGCGGDHGDGTARVTAVTVLPAGGGHDKERCAEEDRLSPITV